MGQVEAVLIAGPTASGKSAAALAVARAIGGAVVNADSMQVYADLRVLTARPTPSEEATCPHHLYGTVDGAVNFSVGHYVAAVADLLPRLRAAGRVPVFVGGTGLYLKALADGLSAIPTVPDHVRASVRARFEGRPTPEIHAALAASDPHLAARLKPNDRLRLERALEVREATGRSIASYRDSRAPGPLAGRRTLRVRLVPDRQVLRERIDLRFDHMVEHGALDEVEALAARDLDPILPVMRAHGVPALMAHRRGELPLAAAIERGQADTRAYAKRQFTWARTQMDGWLPVSPEEATASILAAIAERRQDARW